MKTVTPAIVLTAAIAVLYSCPTSQAEILVGDYQNLGDGLLTIDTDSGLEWLRWSKTAGISYNSMVTLFGVGETYDGWRHATSDEARVLLGDGFGLPLANWPEVTRIDDRGAQVRKLISFFGQDPTGFIIDTAAARLQPEGGNQLKVHASDGDFEASFIGTRAGPDADSEGFTLEFGGGGFFIPVTGHALVRLTNPVPEPTSLSLMCCLGFGLVGLPWHQRKMARS